MNLVVLDSLLENGRAVLHIGRHHHKAVFPVDLRIREGQTCKGNVWFLLSYLSQSLHHLPLPVSVFVYVSLSPHSSPPPLAVHLCLVLISLTIDRRNREARFNALVNERNDGGGELVDQRVEQRDVHSADIGGLRERVEMRTSLVILSVFLSVSLFLLRFSLSLSTWRPKSVWR